MSDYEANLYYQNKFHKSFIIYFFHQDEHIWIQSFKILIIPKVVK